MNYWKPHFSMEALPTSSAESQVKYLSAVVKAKQHEINSLRNQLDALRLEHAIERKEFEEAVKSIKQISWNQYPPKKPRWRFWRK